MFRFHHERYAHTIVAKTWLKWNMPELSRIEHSTTVGPVPNPNWQFYDSIFHQVFDYYYMFGTCKKKTFSLKSKRYT
jgi:hypothetical protein